MGLYYPHNISVGLSVGLYHIINQWDYTIINPILILSTDCVNYGNIPVTIGQQKVSETRKNTMLLDITIGFPIHWMYQKPL